MCVLCKVHMFVLGRAKRPLPAFLIVRNGNIDSNAKDIPSILSLTAAERKSGSITFIGFQYLKNERTITTKNKYASAIKRAELSKKSLSNKIKYLTIKMVI